MSFVAYEYGKQVPTLMKAALNPIFKSGLAVTPQTCRSATFPLDAYSKWQLFRLVEALHRSNCPSVVDAISGPMIHGYAAEDEDHSPIRAIALHMSMRGSHLRNVPVTTQGIVPKKMLVMVNPEIEPEPHTGTSL